MVDDRCLASFLCRQLDVSKNFAIHKPTDDFCVSFVFRFVNMSDYEKSDTSVESDSELDEELDESTQKMFEMLANLAALMSSSETKAMQTSTGIFETLLSDFKQTCDTIDHYPERIRRLLQLCKQLIEHTEQATDSDTKHFLENFYVLVSLLRDEEFNTVIKNEEPFAREIFFVALDTIKNTSICLYLSNDQNLKELQKRIYKLLSILLILICNLACPFVEFLSSDATELHYTDVFINMCKNVQHGLESSSSNSELSNLDNQPRDCILSFLWNLSDRTIVIPWLLEANLAKNALAWSMIPELPQDTFHSIVSILHNISRHDDGADQLMQMNGLQTLTELQNNSVIMEDGEINLVTSMAVALLSTPEQIRSDKKRRNKILNQLLQITIDAAKVSALKSVKA